MFTFPRFYIFIKAFVLYLLNFTKFTLHTGFNDNGAQWRACNYEEPEEHSPDNKDLFIEDMVDDLLVQVWRFSSNLFKLQNAKNFLQLHMTL